MIYHSQKFKSRSACGAGSGSFMNLQSDGGGAAVTKASSLTRLELHLGIGGHGEQQGLHKPLSLTLCGVL